MTKVLIANIVIFLFLTCNISLLVHSYVTHDVRFGWGMFSSYISYRIEYYCATDETKKPCLQTQNLNSLDLKRMVSSQQVLFTYYGEGAVIQWVEAFLPSLFTKQNSDISGIIAEIYFLKNGTTLQESTVTYP